MTLAPTRPHFDAAIAYLELTGTMLRACRTYFSDCGPTMATVTAVVTEVEARATRPGHPASTVARRWRTCRVFGLATELREGLAGVRLMVESATSATGNAAGELGCCEESVDETAMHAAARSLVRRTTAAHACFVQLTGRLRGLDGIFNDLRADPWSVPDRQVVEQLRRKVASGDLTRAHRELATTEELLTRVLAEISAALQA